MQRRLVAPRRRVLSLALLATLAGLVASGHPAAAANLHAHIDAASRHWAGRFTAAPPPARIEAEAGLQALSPLPPRIESDPQHGVWSLLAGSGNHPFAPRRTTHTAIHDPLRSRMVVFGGGDEAYLNDTWVSNAAGTSWSWLVTGGSPPGPRRLHSAVYDAANDRMVVYGGYADNVLGDVWELSFQTSPPTWSQLAPVGGAPVARAAHAAIYDAAGQRMIVFAGWDGVSEPSQRRADVWSLSLDATPTWTEITPAGAGPSARSSLEAVYDAPRQRMVIFGGTDPDFRNDAWALSLSGTPAWSDLSPAGGLPAAREEHSAIYDVGGERLIVFGGYDDQYYYGDLWQLTLAGTPAWTELAPAGMGPSPRWGHTAVYDAIASRMVLFGGRSFGLPSDTYHLDLLGALEWTNPIEPPGPAPHRHTFASAYDSNRHRYLLFGGSDVGSYINSTWAITLGEHPEWHQIPTQGTPPSPRRLVEGVYDPVGDRLIVFGGFDGYLLGGLHQLSFATEPPTWSVLAATGTPPAARGGHGAIYDPVGRRMIVFGGFDGVSANYRRNDLWALELGHDPAVWRQLSPTGTSPSPRSSPTVVYDSREHRMILFAGTTPSFLNETWALSLAGDGAWTPIQPAGTLPSAREEQSAMYDPVRHRMIVFGGYEDTDFRGTADTWALSLGSTPTWTLLSPAGPRPPYRWGHAAVYDPTHDRMVMHGGYGPGLDQTWALTWGQPEHPDPRLVRLGYEGGAVHVAWDVSGGNHLEATIYRSVDGGPWTTAGNASVGPGGETLFEDRAIAAGQRYGYRAGVRAGATELLSSPGWVEIPANADVPGRAATLGILSSRARGAELTVRVSLPASGAARLALVDVGGRVRATRHLDAAAAGTQEVALAGRSSLPAGVYWLRLTQGDRAATARTVVVP